MTGMLIDASELNALAADLGRVSAKSTFLAAAAVQKTAYDIEREAKAFCPVDTGNLRNSISTSVTGLAAEVGPTADYGHWVEEGTSVTAPAAYMGPAFDRRAPDLVTALEQIAGNIL